MPRQDRDLPESQHLPPNTSVRLNRLNPILRPLVPNKHVDGTILGPDQMVEGFDRVDLDIGVEYTRSDGETERLKIIRESIGNMTVLPPPDPKKPI